MSRMNPGVLAFIIIAALSIFGLAACSDNSTTVAPGDGGVTPDGTTGGDGSIAGDTGGLTDAGPTDAGGSGTACSYMTECAKPEDCIAGFCRKASRCHCDPVTDTRCLCGATSAGDTQCVPYQACLEGRMVNVCKTDLDCPKDGFCHDGICEKFDFSLTTPVPDKDGVKGTLKAGYAEVPLDFPVGVSMAGYGARSGPKTPYNKDMGGSTGFYDRPIVKALVLDNGAERVAFLRVTSCWSTDYMNTMIAQKLSDTLGENYIDRIVTSAAHSHSLPARFWTVAYGTGLGSLGSEEFNWEIFDRITTSYALAIENAVKALVPAKIGWSRDDNFDPENKVTASRSDDTFGKGNKDKHFLVMRVDYTGGANDGKTMAVIMRYGSHGTHMHDTLISGDAPHAAEYVSEESFERDLGYHVPVIFMNGDAGNVSPSGYDGFRDDGLQAITACGTWLYPMLKDRYDAVTNFVGDPDIKIVSKRVPLDRDHVGYTNDQFFLNSNGVKKPYWNGAFQCAGSYKAAGWQDGALGCMLLMDDLNYGADMPEFSKLRVTAVRIGGLLLATLPGEPTSPLVDKVMQDIQTATGLTDVFTIGYSQDHQFYLLLEEDWMKGSYESSMDVWGFKVGEYLAAQALEVATQLKDGAAPVDNSNNMKPSWYSYLPHKSVTPSATTTGTPGQFYTQPAAAITKGDVVKVEWHGGHPGVDHTHIYLEAKDQGGTWATLKTAGGVDYDDGHFHMIIEYLGDFKGTHDWRARWQELPPFAAGTYRFRVDGSHYDGSKAVDYTATSGEFAVADITNIELRDAKKSGGKITVKANYPTPNADAFRLNSVHVPMTLGAPLYEDQKVTVDVTCGTATPLKADVTPVLSADTESRTDAGGKAWDVAYTTLTFDDIGDGSCAYTITVTDPWGNTGTLTKTIQ